MFDDAGGEDGWSGRIFGWRYFILEIRDGFILEKAVDLQEWADWFQKASETENSWPNRFVMRTWIGSIFVSTVFLGINHRYGPGTPLIYETMVFLNWGNTYCRQCGTYREAVAQHRKALWLLPEMLMDKFRSEARRFFQGLWLTTRSKIRVLAKDDADVPK